jgi:hypothetical protein
MQDSYIIYSHLTRGVEYVYQIKGILWRNKFFNAFFLYEQLSTSDFLTFLAAFLKNQPSSESLFQLSESFQ